MSPGRAALERMQTWSLWKYPSWKFWPPFLEETIHYLTCSPCALSSNSLPRLGSSFTGSCFFPTLRYKNMRCPDVLLCLHCTEREAVRVAPCSSLAPFSLWSWKWWLLQAKWSRTSLVITLPLSLDSLQTWLNEISGFLIIRRPEVSLPFDGLLNESQVLLFAMGFGWEGLVGFSVGYHD
jgi:hypothetical protein